MFSPSGLEFHSDFSTLLLCCFDLLGFFKTIVHTKYPMFDPFSRHKCLSVLCCWSLLALSFVMIEFFVKNIGLILCYHAVLSFFASICQTKYFHLGHASCSRFLMIGNPLEICSLNVCSNPVMTGEWLLAVLAQIYQQLEI